MKTMIWRGGNNFTLDKVEIPKVIEGTCLIKTHTAGVCGTDVHITQGLFPSPVNVALGHEFSGEVIEKTAPSTLKINYILGRTNNEWMLIDFFMID